MRVIMSAANCSPAVVSRRAKYDGDFRVPTFLGALPLDHLVTRYKHSRYINNKLRPLKEIGGQQNLYE
jgi:hypothetical protein